MKNIKIATLLFAGAILMSGCSNTGTAIKVGNSTVSTKDIQFCASELMSAGGDFEETKKNTVEAVKEAFTMKEVASAMGLELDEDEQDDINSSLIRMRQSMGGKKAFDNLLKQYGSSEEFVKVLFAESDYASKIEEEMAIPEATDEELQQYFKEKYLRAKHVLIMCDETATEDEKTAAEAKANDIMAQAQSGADFDTLVADNGEDPGMSSKPDGYVFTDNEMVSEFEETTKSLQPGEIGMCKTSYGYHVILRLALDETPDKFAQFFEDNKSAVSRSYSNVKFEDAISAKAEELGIKVEVNDKAVEKVKEIEKTSEDN